MNEEPPTKRQRLDQVVLILDDTFQCEKFRITLNQRFRIEIYIPYFSFVRRSESRFILCDNISKVTLDERYENVSLDYILSRFINDPWNWISAAPNPDSKEVVTCVRTSKLHYHFDNPNMYFKHLFIHPQDIALNPNEKQLAFLRTAWCRFMEGKHLFMLEPISPEMHSAIALLGYVLLMQKIDVTTYMVETDRLEKDIGKMGATIRKGNKGDTPGVILLSEVLPTDVFMKEVMPYGLIPVPIIGVINEKWTTDRDFYPNF
jgi:hypothetical protein